MERYRYDQGDISSRNRPIKRRRQRGVPVWIVCVLLVCVFAFSRWTGNGRAPVDAGGQSVVPDGTHGASALNLLAPEGSTLPNSSGALPQETQWDMPKEAHLDSERWYLTLVNPWNSLPKEYSFSIKNLNNGHAVDQRCYPDLQDMMDDCRATGLTPVICSSHRSLQDQERLFGNKVSALMAQGISESDARVQTSNSIAYPGTSEHQLGLALDIVDINNQNLDSTQEQTEVQQWLMQNSWRYGFILRYPSDKGEITGIMYEPWHYRYVGKEVAQYIYENNICLEEYLDSLT